MDAYVKNDLVYIPIQKCASTYYSNLVEHNGFDRTELYKINPNTHKLIAFILNPTTRFIKGLTEDLYYDYDAHPHELDFEKQALRANLLNIIQHDPNHLYLADHNFPIHLRLTNLIPHITWIKITKDKSHHNHFLNICKQHNIDIANVEVNSNISNRSKLTLYNKLSNIFTEQYLLEHHLYKHLYAKDYEIYNSGR